MYPNTHHHQQRQQQAPPQPIQQPQQQYTHPLSQQQQQQEDELSSKVELYIRCNNLKNMDILSLSDPCVVLQTDLSPPNKNWREVGRTEVIMNNLNPIFTKTFPMIYKFEEVQPMRFQVYDIDHVNAKLEENDFIGSMTCTLAEICGSRGMQITRNLVDQKGHVTGTITITGNEISNKSNESIHLTFYGHKLAKKDFFGKSDPYFILSKPNNSNSNITSNSTIPAAPLLNIYQSEVVKYDLNPRWKSFTLSKAKLCNGDDNLPIRFQCYDWDRYSSPDFIGQFDASLNDIVAKSREGGMFTLIDNHKGKNKVTGHVGVSQCQIDKNYSFLEYVQGGCELSLIIAVDFTASNKNPRDPTSLHFNHPANMNEYERAIRSVGDILSHYDYDQKFPCFGFGAKMPNGQISHCFSLNGNPYDPECIGIDGVLAAYKQAIYNVELWGPTNFSDTIRAASRYASRYVDQNNQHYFILLIITDGAISDVNETVQAIIDASSLPLSIVIVGVGGADFSTMEFLDSDDQLLNNGKSTAKRDIVQFVPFRKIANQHYSALAAETLAEIPTQLQEFMKLRNIRPNPKVQVPESGPINSNVQPSSTLPIVDLNNINVTYNPNAGFPRT